MKLRVLLYSLFLALLTISCDDEAEGIGITDRNDIVTVTKKTYPIISNSLLADSVLAHTTTTYLGRVLDNETGAYVSCSFLTQYYPLENFYLPEKQYMQQDALGQVEADSVTLHLYIGGFYGDSLSLMKMQVYELDSTHILREDENYYTKFDINPYINPKHRSAGGQLQNPFITKVFSIADQALTDSARNAETHYINVGIKLPKAYGSYILNKYYENKKFFSSGYYLSRHVLPGYYFEIDKSSDGSMLYVDFSSVEVHYSYKNAAGKTISNYCRFTGTSEVVETNLVENESLQDLITNPDVTYLKTPAGIFTEVTLPIEDVFRGHETDSINAAKLTLTRYNNIYDDHHLDSPDTLLLVRKADLYYFFEHQHAINSITSYYTSRNTSYNTYSFNNIARLLNVAINEKRQGTAGKDWDKVVLVPVVLTSASNATTKVTHDLHLRSARLVRANGTETKFSNLEVTYSKY